MAAATVSDAFSAPSRRIRQRPYGKVETCSKLSVSERTVYREADWSFDGVRMENPITLVTCGPCQCVHTFRFVKGLWW